MLPEASYAAGDVFELAIKYLWFGSPHPDYTIKVYSKQNLAIRDSSGNQVQQHMDGSSPSGFTSSEYKGMDASFGNSNNVNHIDTVGTTDKPKYDPTVPVKSLWDTIEKSTDILHFFILSWENPWVMFIWFNWW